MFPEISFQKADITVADTMVDRDFSAALEGAGQPAAQVSGLETQNMGLFGRKNKTNAPSSAGSSSNTPRYSDQIVPIDVSTGKFDPSAAEVIIWTGKDIAPKRELALAWIKGFQPVVEFLQRNQTYGLIPEFVRAYVNDGNFQFPPSYTVPQIDPNEPLPLYSLEAEPVSPPANASASQYQRRIIHTGKYRISEQVLDAVDNALEKHRSRAGADHLSAFAGDGLYRSVFKAFVDNGRWLNKNVSPPGQSFSTGSIFESHRFTENFPIPETFFEAFITLQENIFTRHKNREPIGDAILQSETKALNDGHVAEKIIPSIFSSFNNIEKILHPENRSSRQSSNLHYYFYLLPFMFLHKESPFDVRAQNERTSSNDAITIDNLHENFISYDTPFLVSMAAIAFPQRYIEPQMVFIWWMSRILEMRLKNSGFTIPQLIAKIVENLAPEVTLDIKKWYQEKMEGILKIFKIEKKVTFNPEDNTSVVKERITLNGVYLDLLLHKDYVDRIKQILLLSEITVNVIKDLESVALPVPVDPHSDEITPAPPANT